MTMKYQHEDHEPAWKSYKGPAPKLPEIDGTESSRAMEYLCARGLDPGLAHFNGWYPTFTDAPRIVIPCVNSAGSAYYQARLLINDETKRRYDSPSAPRGDSVVIVYPKGLHNRVAVVEGPMDALASAAFGYVGVALMGNKPADEALDLIVSRFGATHAPFLIIPDKDDEGFGAQLIAAFATRGVAARVVLVPHGKDLCEMSLQQRSKFFSKQKGRK